MRDTQKQYIAVGTFLLVMLCAFILWVGILSGFTTSTDRYVVEYENVMGLTDGSQVLYEGYPIGEVDHITLKRDGPTSHYRVDLRVQKGWSMPQDSLATITQSGLLSAVVIDIHEGRSSQFLMPGDQIPSQGSAHILTTMASVAHTLGELADTNLKPLLENLTNGTGALENVSKDVPGILANLKTFTAQLNDTTHRLNTLIERSEGHVDVILTDVETASGKASSLMVDFRRTSNRLDQLLLTMNAVVSRNQTSIDHSMEDLHHTLEVVASHVQEISFNLEASTRNMNELTAEMRRNPGVLIRGKKIREERELVN